MNVEIYNPFKEIKFKKQNVEFNIPFVSSILIIIIMMVIPVLFLPYNYARTIQLLLTYYFTAIALISFGGIKLFKIIKEKKKFNLKMNIKLSLVNITLIIYVFLILISAVNSHYFPASLTSGSKGRFEGATTLYLYIILFYIAYKAFKFNNKYLPYMAISTLIVSFVGILQSIILYPISKYTYMAYSSFGNPNFFSTYLSIFLPIYMIVYLKKRDNFYLITSIVTFMALICSSTSGGYITFLIYSSIILIYAIATKVKFKNIAILFSSFIIAFVILNLCTNNAYINEGVGMIKQQEIIETDSNSFANGRGLIYKIGFKIVKDNPLLGIGPDCLGAEILSKYYSTPEYTSKVLFDKAHCEYLHIAICTGIPSLIAYLVFICTIAFKMLKKFFSDTSNVTIFAVGMSIFSYLVQAVPNISVTHVAPMFWIMLGIGLSLCKDNKEQQM